MQRAHTQAEVLGLTAVFCSAPQTFVKVVNYQHMMPTRYTLDLDLKTAVPTDAVETSEKRKTARQVRHLPHPTCARLALWSCCSMHVRSRYRPCLE